jgi:hypothetical protein
MEGRFMTADIITLDDFRRDDVGRAKIPTSRCEDHVDTFWQSPYATLPDPLPKDWGEFWKVSDFWWRRQVTAIVRYWGRSGHDGLWHR